MAANLIHSLSVFAVSDCDDEGCRGLLIPGVQEREEMRRNEIGGMEWDGMEPALLFLVVQPDSSNSSTASEKTAKSNSDIEGIGMSCDN